MQNSIGAEYFAAASIRKAVDQFQGFLKSVDQDVDQAPENEKGANSIPELTLRFHQWCRGRDLKAKSMT